MNDVLGIYAWRPGEAAPIDGSWIIGRSSNNYAYLTVYCAGKDVVGGRDCWLMVDEPEDITFQVAAFFEGDERPFDQWIPFPSLAIAPSIDEPFSPNQKATASDH